MKLIAVLLSFLFTSTTFAQTTLLHEDFNQCGNVLPAGWEVVFTGSHIPVWYVGIPVNPGCDSTSIDGTCMVVMDDDLNGNNTPEYTMDVISPAFDATGYTTVTLSADVHYRDWEQADETFSIWVTDGISTEKLLELGDYQSTGTQFSEFKNYNFDLSFGFAKPNVRLIFRYDDDGIWNWWAGFDNVLVTAEDLGENVVLENFNNCVQPADWETEILSGDFDWLFSPIYNDSYNGVETMNGSCFAFFDDDVLGDTALYSTARLYSPWIDGSKYADFKLNFDLIHRFWSETFTVLVENTAGEEFYVQSWSSDLAGPLYDNYENITLDLSPFRDLQMRVIFQYDDGQQYAWWTGMDNVKIIGNGVGNDLCDNAIPLISGQNCLAASTRNTFFDGPPSACAQKSAGGRWYRWQADFTGWAKVTTASDFNEVVTVFTGTCTASQTQLCNNRDEHGFTGEDTYFQVTNGTTYLLRISGEAGGFGIAKGSFCIKINQVPAAPLVPANDNCQNAQSLAVNANCLNTNNLNAKTLTPLPSHDLLARANIWYSFQAPSLLANERLEINTDADYSDVITLYRGGCNNLTEVAANEYGQKLLPENLIPGQTYRLQIAGTFATVEGGQCVEIKKANVNIPTNEDCIGATAVTIGANCIASNNQFAAIGGHRPPCAVSVSKDIWFKFVAPTSGAVHINTGAEFEHVAAVWQGTCANLEPIFCLKNPLRCDGYFTVGELLPGQTYYLQIAATDVATDFSGGDFCIEIQNGINQPTYTPLQLTVTELCTGIQTAKLLLETSGGEQPLQITDPSGGQSVPSGENYLVVVRDARGCEVSAGGIVDECTEAQCLLTATATVFQPVCYDAQDGSILVEATNGTTPYTYNWSVAGQSGNSVTNLVAGIYYVTITDNDGCSVVLSRSLINPPPVFATISSFTEPNIGQSNGEIVINLSNGTAPFTFQWQLNGQNFATSRDLFNIAAGTYSLLATDANGCTATLTYTLDASVAASEPKDGWLALISPNPAADFTFLELKMPASTNVELSLFDAYGKLILTAFEQNIAEKQIRLGLNGLAAGVYDLWIFVGERRFLRKVVVL